MVNPQAAARLPPLCRACLTLVMGNTVTYERDGHIATITYNRPEAMNAINGQLRRDLNAAWEQLRVDDEAWVAIVTGAGKAFCAGADLKDPGSAVGNDEHSFWEVPSFTSLESGKEIWKPVIAAVNGYAIGFGLTMVAACDIVVASERAEFGFPEVQLGVPTCRGRSGCPGWSAGRAPWSCCCSATGSTPSGRRRWGW